jgi:hypothetical protein
MASFTDEVARLHGPPAHACDRPARVMRDTVEKVVQRAGPLLLHLCRSESLRALQLSSRAFTYAVSHFFSFMISGRIARWAPADLRQLAVRGWRGELVLFFPAVRVAQAFSLRHAFRSRSVSAGLARRDCRNRRRSRTLGVVQVFHIQCVEFMPTDLAVPSERSGVVLVQRGCRGGPG